MAPIKWDKKNKFPWKELENTIKERIKKWNSDIGRKKLIEEMIETSNTQCDESNHVSNKEHLEKRVIDLTGEGQISQAMRILQSNGIHKLNESTEEKVKEMFHDYGEKSDVKPVEDSNTTVNSEHLLKTIKSLECLFSFVNEVSKGMFSNTMGY